MKQRIEKWLADYRRKRHDKAFLNGYGWAWAAYMCEGIGKDQIEALGNGTFDTDNTELHFDLGVRAAVNDIEDMEAEAPKGSPFHLRERRSPYEG